MSAKTSKLVLYGACAAGGLLFFALSFVGFCALRGSTLSEVALIGRFFAKPASDKDGAHSEASNPSEVAQGAATTAEGSLVPEHGDASGPAGGAVQKPHLAPSKAALGVLSTFALESPYKTRDLQKLVDELKSALEESERRLTEVEEREHKAQERESVLAEREQRLAEQHAVLEGLQAELSLRKAEVERDEKARAAALANGAVQMAVLFQTGKPDELSKRLLKLEPAEAALVLRALSDERAAVLLNALPPDKWKDYATAFSLVPKSGS